MTSFSITVQRVPGTQEGMGRPSQGTVKYSWVSDYNHGGGTATDWDVHVYFVRLERKFIACRFGKKSDTTLTSNCYIPSLVASIFY